MTNQVRTDWDSVPAPIDASIYQGSDQPLVFYPYGTTFADYPASWSSTYSYYLEVYDESAPGTILLGGAILGTNNGSTGAVSFAIARATRMALDWTAPKKYQVREVVAAATVDAPIAGTFTLLLAKDV